MPTTRELRSRDSDDRDQRYRLSERPQVLVGVIAKSVFQQSLRRYLAFLMLLRLPKTRTLSLLLLQGRSFSVARFRDPLYKARSTTWPSRALLGSVTARWTQAWGTL